MDAHVHFSQSGSIYTRPDAIDLTKVIPYKQDVEQSKARLDETFRRYLASGVTTVVDAGGPLWIYEVRNRASSGVTAPRVAVAGALIATEPAPETTKLDWGEPIIVSAASPREAAELARAQLQRKPDLIKIWGIGSGPEGSARVRDITRAVVAVARPAGVRVAVHATRLETAEAALDGGADVLVHSVEDAPLTPAFIAKLKANNAVYVSTLMVHEGYRDAFLGQVQLTAIERGNSDPNILASLYEMPHGVIERATARYPADPVPQVSANALALLRAGGRLAAGTDAGNIGTLHGPALHRELQMLSQAGLTPSQVLTAATRDAAFAYSARPDIGVLAPNYRADLLILDADPLKSVSNLSRISQVWSRGVAYRPSQLLPSSPELVVERQLQAYNSRDLDNFLATYAENVQVYDLPVTTKPSIEGKAAMRKIYGDIFQKFPAIHCRGAQRMVEGRFVIDQEVCSLDPAKPPFHASATYEVVDGVIRRVWFADAQVKLQE
ncbi:amidohydrolase family protein [Sphingomonas swuensis]|uniref:Amidohydrolase family protein n=1 Tax=Sphingomonas swuensis TaxID=977800 RepID=A0ABP7SLM8_9SPHN